MSTVTNIPYIHTAIIWEVPQIPCGGIRKQGPPLKPGTQLRNRTSIPKKGAHKPLTTITSSVNNCLLRSHNPDY